MRGKIALTLMPPMRPMATAQSWSNDKFAYKLYRQVEGSRVADGKPSPPTHHFAGWLGPGVIAGAGLGATCRASQETHRIWLGCAHARADDRAASSHGKAALRRDYFPARRRLQRLCFKTA